MLFLAFPAQGQFLFPLSGFLAGLVWVCVHVISAHLSITSRLNPCLCLLSVNFIILRCDWLQFVEFVKFFSLSLFYILFLRDVLKAHKTQWTASTGNIYSFGTWPFFPSFFSRKQWSSVWFTHTHTGFSYLILKKNKKTENVPQTHMCNTHFSFHFSPQHDMGKMLVWCLFCWCWHYCDSEMECDAGVTMLWH